MSDLTAPLWTSQTTSKGRVPKLVVPVQPCADEAFASVVARATRANVLGSTQIILREIGLELAHPGTAGQEIGGRTHHLAQILGCSEEGLQAIVHPYIDAKKRIVKWGGGTMRRNDLLLDRRRIAPKAVRAAPYVRADWLCRYLPYDPTTGEELLDTCPSCNNVLRWSRAWGIGSCENCRENINNVVQPKLPANLLQPYRRFAGLLSIVPAIRESARETLDQALAELPQPILVDLILSLGIALGSEPKPIGRARLRQLGNAEMAAAAAAGIELIEDWPNGVQRRARMLIEGRGEEGDHKDAIRAIRSLGSERAFHRQQVELFREVLPEIFADTRRAVGLLDGPVLLQRDICRKAGISSREVRSLAEARVLPVRVVSGDKRCNIQFSADEAEEFCQRRRASMPIEAAASQLGLPIYAIEQLIDAEFLEQELHPAVLLIDQQPRVPHASLEQLRQRLADRFLLSNERTGLITLRQHSRRIGGGLKAWDQVLRAILTGDVATYRAADGTGRALIDQVLCAPGSLVVGLSAWNPKLRNGQPRQSRMTQRDACEVLNLDAMQIKPVVEAGWLGFEKCGLRLTCSITEVLAYATKMVPPSELADRLGTRSDAVHATMRRLFPAVEKMPGGWSREQVAAALTLSNPSGDAAGESRTE